MFEIEIGGMLTTQSVFGFMPVEQEEFLPFHSISIHAEAFLAQSSMCFFTRILTPPIKTQRHRSF